MYFLLSLEKRLRHKHIGPTRLVSLYSCDPNFHNLITISQQRRESLNTEKRRSRQVKDLGKSPSPDRTKEVESVPYKRSDRSPLSIVRSDRSCSPPGVGPSDEELRKREKKLIKAPPMVEKEHKEKKRKVKNTESSEVCAGLECILCSLFAN